LRAKPGTMGTSPVRVTERGVPTPEEESDQSAQSTPPPVAAEPAPSVAAAPPPAATAAALDEASEHGRRDGQKTKDVAGADAPTDKRAQEAQTALASARAARNRSGCTPEVLRRYDELGTKYVGTPEGAQARWEAANCFKDNGETAKARELYLSLK